MAGFFNVPKKKAPGNKPVSCSSCGLYLTANTPKMEPFGNFKKRILNIGPAPTGVDDAKGRQWQGVDGKTLQRALRASGIDLFEDCLNINAVNCHTKTPTRKDRAPTSHEIACCRSRVFQVIEDYEPAIIILHGITAIESVIGGRWKKDLGGLSRWRGWVIPDRDLNAWVCPVYHPSDLERQTKLKELEKDWQADLKQAISYVGEPLPEFPDETKQVVILEDREDILTELNRLNQGEFYPEDCKWLAFDIETTGLKPQDRSKHRISCISFCENENRAVVFPYPKRRSIRAALKVVLENPQIGKVAANMKFEDTWMKVVSDIDTGPWEWDTMQAAHIIDNRPHISDLKFQTYVNFGVIDYASEVTPFLQKSDPKNANSVNEIHKLEAKPELFRKLLLYCGLDALFEFKLAKKQKHFLETERPNQLKAYQLTHDGILAFAKAERHGICIDVDYCEKRTKLLTRTIEKEREALKETKLFQVWQKEFKEKTNLDSNHQLSKILYENLKIKVLKETAKGKGSTDEDTLHRLEDKVQGLSHIVRIRKLLKIRDTYLASFYREQINGKVHPFFNLHTVRTYRSSSSNPNFQNIPVREQEAMKICRRAIVPRPGHQLLEIDFSGLEVMIAACYHKDKTMLKYLHDPLSDMHGDMAQQVFKIETFDKHKHKAHDLLRKAAKNGFVFPQFYGDYYKNNAIVLSEWVGLPRGKWKPGMGIEMPGGIHISDHLISMGIKSYQAFEKHLEKVEDDFWNNRFPEYKKWKDRWVTKYLQKGFLEMLTGYLCSGIARRNEIINYPIQGAAFHCLLWCFIQITNIMIKEGWRTRLIGQVHDSILFDVHPDELLHVAKTVRRVTTVDLLKAWKWIIVPLEIEADLCGIDESWSKKQPWKMPEVK